MLSEKESKLALIIRDHPAVLFLVLYAIQFLACSLCIDLLRISSSPSPNQYLFPLPLTAVFWLSLRSWARKEMRSI
jgi:hypothetical protein